MPHGQRGPRTLPGSPSKNGGSSPDASSGAPQRASDDPLRTCVFDLEIASPVEECPNGWAGARRGECGVSALVIWDTSTGRYHIYDASTLESALEHLNSADRIVTWNGKDFDVPIVESLTGLKVTARHIDLLEMVWKALGQKQKGYKLGAVAYRTLGLTKNGEGASAPSLVKQDRFAELFDYCLCDVHLTRMLWEHVQKNLFVVSHTGNPLVLMVPR